MDPVARVERGGADLAVPGDGAERAERCACEDKGGGTSAHGGVRSEERGRVDS
jgi:hypothetical protein